MQEKPVAIIPARGGSTGIPRKNIFMINGLPLIHYTIQAALDAQIEGLEVYVSTEDSEIAKISTQYGIHIIDRPSELSMDTTSTEAVIIHALEILTMGSFIASPIILLQATSPLRSAREIEAAYECFILTGADSLLSVNLDHGLYWSGSPDQPKPEYDIRNRPRRQDMSPLYRENGALYITKPEIYLKYKNRLGGKIILYPMDSLSSVDIDEPTDIKIAQCL